MKAKFNKEAEEWTAREILAIPEPEPEQIFPRDEDERKAFYRKLSMRWHPDRNPGSQEAVDTFAHLSLLEASAKRKIEQGTWQTPGLFEAQTTSDTTFKVHYLKKHNLERGELGEFYIGKGSVTFVIKPEFSDLYDNAVRTIENFHFSNDKLRSEFTPQLPKILEKLDLKDGRRVLVVERDRDMVLLRDWIGHEKGKLDSKQVAWIMSRLHNMACYLEVEKLTHNAISVDTCFVSPETHGIQLLGGWWYAAKEKTPLTGLPENTLNYAPKHILDDGIADKTLDHALIRIVGRTALGDPTGVRYDASVPAPMASWLATPGSGNAIRDFKAWDETMFAGFGPRKFVLSDVRADDVYKP